MRDLMGGWNVGRSDWEGYRRNREQGRPYYGPRGSNGQSTFGTRGSQTKKTRPGFYNRQYSDDKLFLIKFQAEWARPARAVLAGGALPPVHLESRGKPIGNLRITFC